MGSLAEYKPKQACFVNHWAYTTRWFQDSAGSDMQAMFDGLNQHFFLGEVTGLMGGKQISSSQQWELLRFGLVVPSGFSSCLAINEQFARGHHDFPDQIDPSTCHKPTICWLDGGGKAMTKPT